MIPEIKYGDIIQLGEHRLACGSSADKDLLSKLFLPEEKVDMILSDPPYGVNYVEGKKSILKVAGSSTKNLDKFDDIQNDGTIQDYYQFSKDWLEPIIDYLNDKNTYYLFNGDSKMREFMNALHDLEYRHGQLIIWDKGTSIVGRKDYQPMHELIFYGWYGAHKYYGNKDKSIIKCPKPKANKLHPTMKPPQLLRKLLYHSTLPNMVVYDAFAGSGSTLIACEQLNRKCRTVEIDTKYCKTIIERYIKSVQLSKKQTLIKVNDTIITGNTEQNV